MAKQLLVVLLLMMIGLWVVALDTQQAEAEGKIEIELHFWRYGGAKNTDWSDAKIQNHLDEANGIWRPEANINFTKKMTSSMNDKDPGPMNPDVGDMRAPSTSAASRAEANTACQQVIGTQADVIHVILIQEFVDANGNPVAGLHGTTPPKTAMPPEPGPFGNNCNIIAKDGNKTGQNALAHELGHNLGLNDTDADSRSRDNLMGGKDGGNSLTPAQKTTARAKALAGKGTKLPNERGGGKYILIGDLNAGIGLIYCIAKVDHQATTNAIQIALQCNSDIDNFGLPPTTNAPPSWQDTCDTLAELEPPECVPGQLQNPTETGPDTIAGPPPPPPYTIQAPQRGRGFFYPGGVGAPGGVCGTTDCSIITACFKETGPIDGTGPNKMVTATTMDPKNPVTVMVDSDGDTIKDTQVDRVASGTLDVWLNQSNASCAALTPKGAPYLSDLPLHSIEAYDKGEVNVNLNPVPWSPSGLPGSTVLDFDGDGCTDEEELNVFGAAKCGDDPQNPSDSFDPNTVDLSGVYDIQVRVVRGDCTDDQCTAEAPGVYLYCRSDLQHNTGNDNIAIRLYCYSDTVVNQINPEAYPGITGDGMAGAPPPGPQDANGSYAFGDVDVQHTELLGTFDKFTNQISVVGCFADPDNQELLGDTYVELTLDAHQLPGSMSFWTAQPDGCAGSPVGEPTIVNAEAASVQANPAKGKGYDQDDDGVPTERELMDDIACGRRDPYNKNDYYDVSIPRDGVIDLPNDILGVILHFAPGGYPPGDENWDRPPVMVGAGAGSTWNRGSPDGVIDLPNDILGVILQFNPGGCPALS